MPKCWVERSITHLRLRYICEAVWSFTDVFWCKNPLTVVVCWWPLTCLCWWAHIIIVRAPQIATDNPIIGLRLTRRFKNWKQNDITLLNFRFRKLQIQTRSNSHNPWTSETLELTKAEVSRFQHVKLWHLETLGSLKRWHFHTLTSGLWTNLTLEHCHCLMCWNAETW